ncbi:hypothetical protein JW868_03740, partial [Candidatus Woesearchaeota archaeon]|nr:hypothetical protein [Candidatus Woesearchaeota archaeon]
IILAIFLAWLKLYRRNIFTHNITEILIYSGIAVILSNIFNLFWASMLLVAIIIYDMIAVWKSGHMVGLAKFQHSSGVFAGLAIPYSNEGIFSGISRGRKSKLGRKDRHVHVKHESGKTTKLKIPKPPVAGDAGSLTGPRTAILGGGDIAFPLIFSGEAMLFLVKQGISQPPAFLFTLIITFFSALALLLLFIYSKPDRFYPAMPFIGAGCFVGLGLVYLLAVVF